MQSNRNSIYQPPQDLLRDRTIVVTGSGDGIGRVAAKTYAQFGADVVLVGRTRGKLESVNDEIVSETSTKPLIVPVDLAQLDEENVLQLSNAIQEVYGHLDGILHNASLLGAKVPLEHYSYTQWLEVFQVNVHSQFLLTKSLLPLLRESKDASIIFTSSGVGRQGRAFWGAYSASKFATEALTEILADELEIESNLRVNSLNPGGTRTSMRAQAFPAEDPNSLPPPADHMPLYLYLMGPDSRGVSGQKFDAQTWKYVERA
ncbi:MAG: YciK family oxidoreductase [Gammaproteobacteria bacterium]|nr:YciK family oxidoreductase [Gammaproteobacteria bacterium]